MKHASQTEALLTVLTSVDRSTSPNTSY